MLTKNPVSKKSVPQKVGSKNSVVISNTVLQNLQYLKKKAVIKKIRVGTICEFKITALGPNNIGIDDRAKNYSVLIPNAKLGEKVKAKILKINFKQNKYAIAKMIEVLEQGPVNEISMVPGEVLEMPVEKINAKGTGILECANNYQVIIPNFPSEKKSQISKIEITRIKSNYAFGRLVENASTEQVDFDQNKSTLTEGSKFTLTIPQNVKTHGKYFILKIQGTFVFVKLGLQAKVGNKIRVKLTSVNQNFAIAKILQINPSSQLKKQKFVKYSISQMLKNGVHLGEKASKCHAKMKNYVWVRKHRKNKKDQHSINLLKTHRCLNKALTRLTKYAFKGRNFLFIGTKQVTAGLIARASLLTKNSFFVNTRWLGGMLTNWETICNSICKIQPILEEKQVIIREILRQRIEIRAKVFKNLALCQKNILKKLTSKKNQRFLKNLENPQFADFLFEQFQNRQQILKLINKLKEDQKSLKKLILEKEFQNRLLASKEQSGTAGETDKATIVANDKWIQLANSTRNHIKIILNFLYSDKNDPGNNAKFIALVKKKMNLIEGESEEYFKSKKEDQASDSNALVLAERNIKKMFQLLSAKKNIVLNVKQVLLLKKLLKILPSLKRFFNISKTKLIQSVDVFMRKIIDLKFKRSFKVFFNLVYKNYIFSNSKKLAYATKKKWQRLEKYLGGISNMIKFSKKAIYNNVAIIVGQKEEMNAVRECRKLGIEMVHIVDTNCNPSFADHIIPANDDSKSSIKYILTKMLVRIRLGQQLRKKLDSKNMKTLLKIKKTGKKTLGKKK